MSTNPKVDICFFIYNNRSDRCMKFLETLDYPKERLNITVYSDRDIVHNFKHIKTSEKEAYNHILIESDGDYIWTIYADYVIQNRSVLGELLKAQKDISSALLVKPASVFSNFWGKLSSTGWYERSDDYLEIVNREKKGAFSVPYITGNILFKTEAFKRNPNLVREYHDYDIDMNLCHNLRDNNEQMYIVSTDLFGYIEETNITKDYLPLAPFTEETALHKDFQAFLYSFQKDGVNAKTEIFKLLGPDIWQFPIFTEEFCDHLVSIAEKKNEWSAGAYTKEGQIDERIGAVENHPTQDIHMTQLGLHDFWLNRVVNVYFKTVLNYLYNYKTHGYNIAFIVKYSEDGQTKLDPHHDASAYTTNIALNTYGTDYTGGGCNFIHKKIECIGNLKGHLIMHPGRITHYHEAYPVKTGTRYILVSFNN